MNNNGLCFRCVEVEGVSFFQNLIRKLEIAILTNGVSINLIF